ncbi:MAG: efflux RND transporter periplasmic adaptor subunit [Anaerolineales bacterium]|nr:efflux RND transporter periplasmic adaptor subunit [Anaerolineales bacterium]
MKNKNSQRTKRSALYIIILLALITSACASNNAPTAIPTIVLDNNASPTTAEDNNITASAVIVPARYTRLSFASVGKVTQVNVKVGDSVKAGETLITLDDSILKAKVKEAEANLSAAQARLGLLKRQKTDQAHLDQANAEVERMQAYLDSANAALAAQSTLAAPFDGVIVEVNVAPAEIVTPGQVVIVLGDLTHFQIETTDLSELHVTKIQIGQPATVFIAALDANFTAKVSAVDRIGATLGGEVVFTVTLDFDDQPDNLRWGMSADAQFDE